MKKKVNILNPRKEGLIYKFNKNRILRNKSIWHFCTPKSASTFLTHVLIEVWKKECIYGRPVPVSAYLAQEPNVFNVAEHLPLFSCKRYYSGHLHNRKSAFLNSDILGPQSKVIIQTRNLKDTCVSMKDHLDNGTAVNPFILSAPVYWHRLSDEEMVNQFRTHLFEASSPNPSIETLVHSFLPHSVIDHTHAPVGG